MSFTVREDADALGVEEVFCVVEEEGCVGSFRGREPEQCVQRDGDLVWRVGADGELLEQDAGLFVFGQGVAVSVQHAVIDDEFQDRVQ